MKPVRGTKLSIKVNEMSTAEEIRMEGIKKHSIYDQYFYSSEDYVLLYPDGKQVVTLRSSDTKFNLKEYNKI